MLSDIVFARALKEASQNVGIVAIGQNFRVLNGLWKQVSWPISRLGSRPYRLIVCCDRRCRAFVAAPAKDPAGKLYLLCLSPLWGLHLLPRVLRVATKTVNKDNAITYGRLALVENPSTAARLAEWSSARLFIAVIDGSQSIGIVSMRKYSLCCVYTAL